MRGRQRRRGDGASFRPGGEDLSRVDARVLHGVRAFSGRGRFRRAAPGPESRQDFVAGPAAQQEQDEGVRVEGVGDQEARARRVLAGFGIVGAGAPRPDLRDARDQIQPGAGHVLG